MDRSITLAVNTNGLDVKMENEATRSDSAIAQDILKITGKTLDDGGVISFKQKIQERKAGVSEEVLEYIASNIQKNVRELEGALKTLTAWKQLHNQEVNVELAKKILKRILERRLIVMVN